MTHGPTKTARAPGAPPAEPVHVKVKPGRTVVMLHGGPCHHWAYYLEEIEAIRACEEYFGREFDYAPTRGHYTVPWSGGVQAIVWRWKGDK